MLNIISAVSSIITCLLFIFYIIGHVWSFFTNKSFNNERFENISSTDIDVSNATRAIVLDDTGTEFGILFDKVSETGCRLMSSPFFIGLYFQYILYNGLT